MENVFVFKGKLRLKGSKRVLLSKGRKRFLPLSLSLSLYIYIYTLKNPSPFTSETSIAATPHLQPPMAEISNCPPRPLSHRRSSLPPDTFYLSKT